MSVNKVNSDGSLKRIAGGTLYADAPLGTILAFGGADAPAGWMICQGQALSRTTYAKLFAIIGTAFGTGDGSTTFNIPDLRGEFLRGAGTNSHSGQGNGGSVGTHQDSTAIQNQIAEQNTHRLVIGFGSGNINMIKNSEGSTKEGLTGNAYMTNNQEITSVYTPFVGVRPTNTSVNYIIKVMMVSLPADLDSAVDAKIAAKGVYSTSEVDTGKTWIDGKKIYRKTIVADLTVPSDGEVNTTMGSIPSTFETIIGATGFCKQGTSNWVPFPRTSISGENQQSLFYFVRTAEQNRGSITLVVKSTDCAGSAKFILTLEYTKTT